MKRKLSLLPAVVFGLAMATGSVFAQIPEIISYQGVDPTNPGATITVDINLYDAATGGTSVFSQQSMPTTDANGMFMVMIGPTGTPALGTLDWTKQYWLELAINGTTISPRTQLTTSPYAFEAAEAMSVADGAITAASLNTGATAPTNGQVLTYDPAAPGSMKWSTVSGGGGGAIDAVVAGPGIQVTTNGGTVTVGLAAGGITGSMIADGAINSQHLAPGAVLSSQIAAFAVLTQHIGPQQVTLPKLNTQGANSGEAIMFNGTQLIYGNPTPGGPAGGELSGTYPNPIIADDVIDGANVIDESLTGADILNESIGVDDIGPDAVGSSEIINESILAEDIATGAVTTDEILNETILAEDIATGAVTTDEILNETILSEDIMDNTIQTDDIMPGPINTVLITNGPPVSGSSDVEWRQIYSELIEDQTIRHEDIGTGAVRSDEILNETILSEDIMNGQVMTVDLADAAVTNIKLALNSVESDNIVNNTILEEDMATGSVNSRVIENESIQAVDIATGAVTTDEILNNTILNEDMATGSVNSRVIEDESITSADIDNETITAQDIATGAVTTDEILNATILEEDIAPSAGPNDYLQSNGTTVFWGPPAFGSIPASAITPGAPDQVLTTNSTGTASEWAYIETPNIADLQVTNPKLAANSVTTDKIVDQDVAPIDLEPSATDGQVLMTQGGTVVWADDGLTLPFSGTDATSGAWAFEVIKTGLSQGAIRGEVDNAANAWSGVMGETNGTGAGVRGLATGAGNGGSFESQGAGTAVVVEATGTGDGIDVTTNGGDAIVADAGNGGGSAIVANSDGADAVVVTAANGNDGVSSTVTGGGDAISATNNGGAGRAIFGENTNAANANATARFESVGAVANDNGVLRVDLNNAVSTGWTGYFTSNGGTGNGIYVETDDIGDAMALHLERGGMKLSYNTANANYTVQPDDIVVYVADNGVGGSTYTITLPNTGDDGQIIWILNGDTDAMGVVAGTLAGPISHGTTAISGDRGMGFIYSAAEAAWVPAGNM